MSDTAQDPHVGSQFGHYVLERRLGSGGMGEVYEAKDTVNDRIVALKLLPPALSNDAKYRRVFAKEARTTQLVQDPHVVPINDFGEIDGRLYIDMQLIDGTDLCSVLQRQGYLSPVRAAAIVQQIASALDAAHNTGVTHRDVKTPNILITSDDFAYLVDFGIAQTAGDDRITAEGTQVGTYAYMPPERFSGQATDLRADIYSLTCVLYECLTGSTPFIADDIAGVIAAHLMKPPPRPSVERSGISKAWDEVIACGMAKNPEDRYASAGALGLAAAHAAENSDDEQPAGDALPAPRAPEHYVVPTDPGFVYPMPGYYEQPSPSTMGVHDDVRFSVFRPTSALIGRWTPLLACIHLDGPLAVDEELGHPRRTLKRRAQGVLGDQFANYVKLSTDSSSGLAEEAELTFVLDLPGFEVQPKSRTFLWLNVFSMHEFHIKAEYGGDGTTKRGKLSIYQDREMLGEMVLAIRVRADFGWGESAP